MIPKKTVLKVFERDGYQCRNIKCNRGYPEDDHALHCHHIKLKSQGGSDDIENLLTLCWECHNLLHAGLIPRIENGV